MFTIRVQTRGLDRTIAQLETMGRATVAELGRALEEEGAMVLRVAQELTPVVTGKLRDSAMVKAAEEGSRPYSAAVEIRFGGPEAPYAAIVHEDLKRRHPHGGQAKFLEAAVNLTSGGRADRIARSIDQARRNAV
jgi:hypothetical protein